MTDNNPLLATTPVPAYDQIKNSDFEPAINAALLKARGRCDAIRDAQSPADFANTIAALERAFEPLERISSTLGLFYGNKADPELRDIKEKISLQISDFNNDVFQDQTLAARFKTVYDQRDTLGLDEQDHWLLRELYNQFEDSGAFLPAAQQARIRKIDNELIGLAAKFNKNLLAAATAQAVLITDSAELAGLPGEAVASMEEAAREKGHAQGWLFIPERLLVDNLLEIAESRSFRQKIFTALNGMGTIAPHDNEPVIKQMQQLRFERANLLGKPHHAGFALPQTMAGDLKRVEKFLRDIEDQVTPAFERDVKTIRDYAQKNGHPGALEPWDINYWALRYKNERLQFDSKTFSEYLELDNSLQGMFTFAEKLFGIKISESKAYPVYHPDVRTFDVSDASSGKPVGILYTDFYQRAESKKSGAWMAAPQAMYERGGVSYPRIISFHTNYMKPPPGSKTFIGFQNMETLWHEFGHALHGLLGTDTKYITAQGTAGSSDFVEIHSKTMDHFLLTKQCLQRTLRHHQTGAPPPEALIDSLIASSTFFKSAEVLKIVQNSLWDLKFHSMDPAQWQGTRKLQEGAMMKTPEALYVRPYPLTRFGHLFSSPIGGYSAGYHSYLWAQAHAADNNKLFREQGVDNPQINDRLRAFYREGSRRDPNKIYEAFRGRPVDVSALLQTLGIEDGASGNGKAAKPPAPPAGP